MAVIIEHTSIRLSTPDALGRSIVRQPLLPLQHWNRPTFILNLKVSELGFNGPMGHQNSPHSDYGGSANLGVILPLTYSPMVATSMGYTSPGANIS